MPCTARRASSSRASSRLCLRPAISAFVEVPGSVVFAFDDGTFAAASQLPSTAIEAPAAHFAQRSDISSLPSKLLDEVYAAVLDAAQLESWSIEALGTRLQASLPAWNVLLHNTRAPAGHRKPVTPLILPNQFLTVTRATGTLGVGAVAVKAQGHAWGDARETLVIDFNFRRHFELPGIASKGYAAALEELPHIFVGHRAQLEALIADISHLMLREYRAKGMSMPPWRTTQALLSLWSTGHTQPAVSSTTSTRPGAAAIARAAREDLDTPARANFPAPPLRARNASMPARVMLGFDVNPEPDSPVSGLVFCPNALGSRASSDAGEDAAPRLFAPGHVGSPEGVSGSSGFASLVGSSGGASPLGSSPEEGDRGSLVLRIAQAALTPIKGKQWLV